MSVGADVVPSQQYSKTSDISHQLSFCDYQGLKSSRQPDAPLIIGSQNLVLYSLAEQASND